jgi:hypothetical protein
MTSSKEYGIPERPLGGVNRPSDNTNLSIPQNFQFSIRRIPNLSYFVQTVALSQTNSDGMDVPFILGPNLKLPSNTARISDFTVTFLTNEDMRNYYEIIKWLREGTPYKDFSEVKPIKDVWEEGVLIYLTNKKVPYKRITFTGIFPTEISGLDFNYSDTESKPLVTTVKFAVNDYYIEEL